MPPNPGYSWVGPLYIDFVDRGRTLQYIGLPLLIYLGLPVQRKDSFFIYEWVGVQGGSIWRG